VSNSLISGFSVEVRDIATVKFSNSKHIPNFMTKELKDILSPERTRISGNLKQFNFNLLF
jgi:hypothetical protein